MEQSPSLEYVTQLIKKFSAFYGTQSFITMFTNDHHWSYILSQMNPIHTFQPYFPQISSNIISPLRLGLPSGLFPPGLPTKILYALVISPIRAK
jgi:hypothetical protein